MKTKHTPGPHKANTAYTIIRDGVRHFPIHAAKRGMIGLALREGDAHLWASAPDLLASLIAMTSAFESHLPDHCNADWYQEWNDAKAAIAKATGSEA